MKKIMPFEYDVFVNECNARGYFSGLNDENTRKSKNDAYAMRTKNGIKVEVKSNCYAVGFGCTDEERALLLSEISTKGFSITRANSKCFYVAFLTADSIVDGLWEIVEVVENVAEIVAKSRKKLWFSPKSYNDIVSDIVASIQFAVARQSNYLLSDARSKMFADELDEFKIVKQSTEYQQELQSGGSGWREHLVPNGLLFDLIVTACICGETEEALNQIYKKYSVIYLISTAQREKLDFQLGYMVTMPKNPDGSDWKLGNDLEARVKLLNAEFVQY